jgi:GPH family glycoside/pentoside/hexuronide:cation symporter
MQSGKNKLLKSNLRFITFFLYSLPSIPLAAAQIAVYIAVPAIYSKIAAVGIGITGLVIMISRVIDMITDPILGTYLDRMVEKVGWKFWLLIGFPLISIGIFILFNPLDGLEIISLLLGVIFVTLGWTFFSIPWWGIGIAISNSNSNDRFKVVSFRELLTIPGVILGLFLIHFSNISGEIFFIISVLFLSPLFIKKIPIPNISNKKGTSYFLNIKNLLKDNSNFKYLCLSYFFIGLSNGVTSILFILFVEFIIGGSPQNFLSIYFISAFMGLPFVYMLASKYNKKRIWISFILLACICFLPVFFLSNNSTTLFMVICIISGFCLSADLIIPSSIQADIIYKEQQKNKSVLVGKIYSVWSFIQKLSLALSAGVCLPLLGYFGFNPSEVNTQLLPLSFAYGIIPIILRIPAIIFAENITLKD